MNGTIFVREVYCVHLHLFLFKHSLVILTLDVQIRTEKQYADSNPNPFLCFKERYMHWAINVLPECHYCKDRTPPALIDSPEHIIQFKYDPSKTRNIWKRATSKGNKIETEKKFIDNGSDYRSPELGTYYQDFAIGNLKFTIILLKKYGKGSKLRK